MTQLVRHFTTQITTLSNHTHRLVIFRPLKTKENYLNPQSILKTPGYQTSKTQDQDNMKQLMRKLNGNSMLKATPALSFPGYQIVKTQKSHKSIIQALVITQVFLPKRWELSVQMTPQLMNRALVKAQLLINLIAQPIAWIIGETM